MSMSGSEKSETCDVDDDYDVFDDLSADSEELDDDYDVSMTESEEEVFSKIERRDCASLLASLTDVESPVSDTTEGVTRCDSTSLAEDPQSYPIQIELYTDSEDPSIQSGLKYSYDSYSSRGEKIMLMPIYLEEPSELELFNSHSRATPVVTWEEDHKEKKVEAQSASWKTEDCSICYEPLQGNMPCVLECTHCFCLSCLEQYINYGLQSGVTELKCPERSCGKELTLFDMNCILSKKDYERFVSIKYHDYKQRKQWEVWCPQLDCSGCAGKPKDGNDKWRTCSACQYSFCSSCRQEKHENISCRRAKSKSKKGESQIQRKTRKSRKLATKNTKACPDCGEVIQKNGGCHHVNCTTCGLQFCWKCRKAANGPNHCQGEKVATVFGAVLLSPVIVVSAAVCGGVYLLESRVLRKNRKRKDCATYHPIRKIGETASLKLYWILD